MSKKTRQKKKIETEKYDILQLDERIRKILKEEENNLSLYKKRLHEVSSLLENNPKYRERRELEKERNKLEEDIQGIEDDTIFAEYIFLSERLIKQYMDILSVPKEINFIGKNKDTNSLDEKKDNILQEFLQIASKYIPIKIQREEKDEKYRCECGNTNEFQNTENAITCERCGLERIIYTIQTNFKDIDRVNMSMKYKYSKKTYFRDTVNRYEGKQNKKIPSKVYEDIDNWFKKHNLLLEGETFFEQHRNITKEHIYMSLSETGHNLHYEDINLLHNQFTGIPCPDISNIRAELFDDFDKIMTAYDKINTTRVNSLNSQYILYQLLKRRRAKINDSDFAMIKSRERLVEYDNIYRDLCNMLEWTFHPSC